jgi:C4-dicarboxylate transporter DctM subunit
VMYLILGCIMEAYSMIILTLPILFPIVTALGFDPIWYGVIMVIMIEQALITPPVGMNLFVMQGVAKDVPLFTIARGALPFVIAMLVCVILLAIFPQIALFLPNSMK